MKKLILVTIFLILSNASFSLGDQFRSNWGVVINVIPVSITTNYSQPNTKVFCSKSHQSQSNNFANIAVGGLIGSVIGNKLSDTRGAGTVGALFGSMIAMDRPNNIVNNTCYEKTIYTNEKITKLSHYNIKVRTRTGIHNIQSLTPYNVHDVIYLN
jgi:uncharacterized protein YcfJ